MAWAALHWPLLWSTMILEYSNIAHSCKCWIKGDLKSKENRRAYTCWHDHCVKYIVIVFGGQWVGLVATEAISKAAFLDRKAVACWCDTIWVVIYMMVPVQLKILWRNSVGLLQNFRFFESIVLQIICITHIIVCYASYNLQNSLEFLSNYLKFEGKIL